MTNENIDCLQISNEKIEQINQKHKEFTDEWTDIQRGKKESTCLFSNCNNPAINSHFFSRSTLELISEKSNVIRPIFDFTSNYHKHGKQKMDPIVRFKQVGIRSKACTFKGFCKEHEKLFSSLDQNKELTIHKDLFIQAYRSLNEYEFMNDKANCLSEKFFGPNISLYHSAIEHGVLSAPKDWIKLIETLFFDINALEQAIPDFNSVYLLYPYNNYIRSSPRITFIYKKTTYQYGLCLQASIKLKNGFEGFVIVTPSTKGTSILIITPNDYKEHWCSYLSNEIYLLCLIEKLMIFDGKWFLSPRIFNSWSDEKKSFLEKDYFFFTEFNFGDPYDFSIFDDIRKKIIDSGQLDDDRKKEELKKFLLPIRNNDEVRYNNLSERLGQSNNFTEIGKW